MTCPSEPSAYFVVTFKVYRPGQAEQFRLFRPNIPAVEYRSKRVYCRVPCADPTGVFRVRPDRIWAGGLVIPTRGASWDYVDGVWSVDVGPSTEAELAKLDLSEWTTTPGG